MLFVLKQCKIMHQQLVEGFLRENREVQKYTYQLFLSHMCEIFMLSWPGFPKVSIPATSEGFQQFSENFQRCSNDLWALLKLLIKDDNFSVFWFH